MIVKFKESITTDDGVVYPAGYTLSCDAMVNLSNGVTQLANLHFIDPVLPLLAKPLLLVGTDDIAKLEIQLEVPKPI